MGTLDVGMKYIRSQGPEDAVLSGFVDSGLADDQDKGCSTTGYIFHFAGGPLDWKSQKQSIVALSTVEAEYLTLSKAGQQSVYLRHLMSTIGCDQKTATILHEDNQGAVKLAYSIGYHPRTKHIGI